MRLLVQLAQGLWKGDEQPICSSNEYHLMTEQQNNSDNKPGLYVTAVNSPSFHTRISPTNKVWEMFPQKRPERISGSVLLTEWALQHHYSTMSLMLGSLSTRLPHRANCWHSIYSEVDLLVLCPWSALPRQTSPRPVQKWGMVPQIL